MNESWFGLDGKSAIVIGGGQGIGESACTLLARAGCNIAVVDMDLERASAVAQKVGALGKKHCAIAANVLDDADVSRSIALAEQQLGGLDILVTVVGQALFKPSLEMSGEDWDFEHQRNLRYVFVAAREFAASLVRRKAPGAIVAISSVNGIQSAPRHVAYGAAKAGLVNLVKSLAVEWARHGIRVNAIAPGTIRTPRRQDTPEMMAKLEQSGVPMQRRGNTDDIGNAVVFLASDMSNYVTGQTLAVDGGWLATNIFERQTL